VGAAGLENERDAVGDHAIGALGDEQAEGMASYELVKDLDAGLLEMSGKVHAGSRGVSLGGDEYDR
jgi:hypothetical protein